MYYLKITWITLKIVFLNAVLKIIVDFYFLFKKWFFSYHIIMESLSLEKENIIKDTRNLFRIKRELNYTTIKDIRNLFGLEKETKPIKDRIIRYMKNLFLSMKKKIIINQ